MLQLVGWMSGKASDFFQQFPQESLANAKVSARQQGRSKTDSDMK